MSTVKGQSRFDDLEKNRTKREWDDVGMYRGEMLSLGGQDYEDEEARQLENRQAKEAIDMVRADMPVVGVTQADIEDRNIFDTN